MTQTDYNEIRSTNVAKVEVEEKVTVEATDTDKERVPKKAVVKGSTVEETKPGLFTRLVRGILGPNGIRAIGSYLGKEVIMPAIKDTLVNTINTGVNMAAYGEDRSRYNGGWSNPARYNNRVSSPTYTNYSSAYHNNTPQQQSINVPTRIKEIQLFTWQDAETVLENLNNDIATFGYARLADYYDYAGQPSTSYTDNAYGWRMLGNVRIVPVRGRYALALPPVEVI